MIKTLISLCCCALLCDLTSISQAEQLSIADFSAASMTGWEEKIFQNQTWYRITTLNETTVLAADSKNSASGLFKKVRIDIQKYPYLNWSWRIDNRLAVDNEKIKSGDDYAARIYVVIDGGILIWRTRGVSYVWANAATKGEIWENAFAGKNAMMIALRDNKDKTATWYREKRNIFKDLQQLFGTEYQFIDAVAIMTDTDNSHDSATAYYGDIFFSEK